MCVLGDLKGMLTLPGGGTLTMGSDIVRPSIKWHKEREAQFAQWQAGMYEFPERKDS